MLVEQPLRPSTRARAIDRELPQTQCTRCGYPSCLAYAVAIDLGEAEINRCPPGGQVTIKALAQLLELNEPLLDPQCGVEGPWRVVRIDESRCIGCTKCLQACPVDAIVGGAKLMHAVIEDDCTGCELCLPPCPVDCIDIIALPNRSASALPARQRTEVQMARTAFDARQQRLTLALKQKQEQQRQRQLESERIKARQLLEEALTRSRAKVRS